MHEHLTNATEGIYCKYMTLPVSYTHLDVYKRQSYGQRICGFAGGGITGFSSGISEPRAFPEKIKKGRRMKMKKWNEVYKMLETGALDQKLELTGCRDLDVARKRTMHVLEEFKKCFGTEEELEIALCSAPGRTEISGNHTDHQHGHVLAAAVNLDFLACAAPNGTNTVRFQSEGWPMTTVDLSDMEPQENEKETTASLVRGVLAQMEKAGYQVGGCDIYAVSSVLPGSGLSSSAACEVLLGVIGNHLFCKDCLLYTSYDRRKSGLSGCELFQLCIQKKIWSLTIKIQSRTYKEVICMRGTGNIEDQEEKRQRVYGI